MPRVGVETWHGELRIVSPDLRRTEEERCRAGEGGRRRERTASTQKVAPSLNPPPRAEANGRTAKVVPRSAVIVGFAGGPPSLRRSSWLYSPATIRPTLSARRPS